jgi:hypothetical protein
MIHDPSLFDFIIGVLGLLGTLIFAVVNHKEAIGGSIGLCFMWGFLSLVMGFLFTITWPALLVIAFLAVILYYSVVVYARITGC